ncbi:MAG: sensor histidine kinase [Frankiaceae bacterium]
MRIRPSVLDVCLAAVSAALTLLTLLEGRVLGVDPPVAGNRWWALPLLLIPSAALLLRRQSPVVTVIAVWIPVAVHAVVTGHGAEGLFLVWPAWVSLYALGAYGSRRQVLAGLLVLVPSLAVHDLFDPGAWRAGEASAWSAALWDVLLVVAPLVGGLVAGGRRVRALTAEKELAQARAQAVVGEERARIARELHDVVTHHVNLIVLQAMAAGGLLDREPDRVREPLAVIERSGREALAEMRRLLGVLREEDALPQMAPQPGVGDLAGLVESARASGLDVALHVTGHARPLPAGLGLAVYRLVQEALTNASRHAAGAKVDVTLHYRGETVDVEVVDDGGMPIGADDDTHVGGGGRGLLGMRERVALYAGQLEVGPTPDGGFAVQARLPTPEPA